MITRSGSSRRSSRATTSVRSQAGSSSVSRHSARLSAGRRIAATRFGTAIRRTTRRLHRSVWTSATGASSCGRRRQAVRHRSEVARSITCRCKCSGASNRLLPACARRSRSSAIPMGVATGCALGATFRSAANSASIARCPILRAESDCCSSRFCVSSEFLLPDRLWSLRSSHPRAPSCLRRPMA